MAKDASTRRKGVGGFFKKFSSRKKTDGGSQSNSENMAASSTLLVTPSSASIGHNSQAHAASSLEGHLPTNPPPPSTSGEKLTSTGLADISAALPGGQQARKMVDGTKQNPEQSAPNEVLTQASSAQPATADLLVPTDHSATSDQQAHLAIGLWLKAFKKSPDDIQAKLKIMDADQKSPREQIDDITKATKTKQEECEAKFWKFNVGKHEIVLRDYAIRIVGSLATIGDVAIQFAPPQASIAWSAVKAVMQTPVIESAQMCALLASTDWIIRIIKRGEIYELVYTTENTPQVALENLESALVDLYSACLELLANLQELLSKNTAARTVHAILNPGETVDLFSKLKELETRLGSEVQACESGRSAAMDARLNDLLHGLDAPLTRIDANVCTLLEDINSKDQIAMLEWISSIPYGKHHNTVKHARGTDTCRWLLERSRFQEWEDSSSSVFMWLQGSPGAGKTFLTSMVVDHVRGVLQRSPNHEGLAYFYCNRNEKERREPLSVLQSYVRQLSTNTRDSGKVQTRLRDLCNEMRSNGSDLSFDVCKQQLLQSINLYPKTTLVLDALDECEPESRGELIDTLELLVSQSERPLKVFISSRPDADIRARFLSQPNIEIQADDNQNDIEKFVNEKIVKHLYWATMSDALRNDISKTLLQKAQGMFQWASLQIFQILKLRTDSAIRNRLGKLPAGLKEAYDEIYKEIVDRDEHEKALAERAFKWVMCSLHPLKSSELLSAIRVDPNSVQFNIEEELDEIVLLDLCRNLLVIDSERDVWRFSHLSVTEYFETSHWTIHQAHCDVAKVCLWVLLDPTIYAKGLFDSDSDHDDDGIDDNFDDVRDLMQPIRVYSQDYWIENFDGVQNLMHPIRVYSRDHWMDHVQTQEGGEADRELSWLLQTFFGSPMDSGRYYRRWFSYLPENSQTSYIKDACAPSEVAVFAMCCLSFYTLLVNWWESAEIDITVSNIHGESLLQLAAKGGSLPICKILVRRGVPVSTLSGRTGKSVLSAALNHGRIDLVKFLVQEGNADVNMITMEGQATALSDAVQSGQINVVKFLVQEGSADVNVALQSALGSVLSQAVYYSNIEMVRYLVTEGKADVDMPFQDGPYGNALVIAAWVGQFEMLKILVLEGNADVNIPILNGNYGSVLAAANQSGNVQILEFLLEAGADVDQQLQVGFCGSALVTAAFYGELDCAKALLEAGAQVNLRVEHGAFKSAVEASHAPFKDHYNERDNETIWREKVAITKLLIEHGATEDGL